MDAPDAGAGEPRRPAVEDLLRELAPQVLGALVRRYGDFDAAEDAVQEALLAAATQWPRRGRAGQPARLADPGRRPAADRPAAQREGAAPPRGRWPPSRRAAEPPEPSPSEDDTLALLFLCCHPALTPGVGDRADAARGRRPDHGRDRRARSWCPRRRWRSGSAAPSSASRRPACRSGCPRADERAERLRAVLHVLYLIFNEGYTSQHRPATCTASTCPARRSG